MTLDKSGSIRLESGDTEIGNSEMEISAEVQGTEQVGLNANYFIEALQVIPQDEVRIGFETSLSPILIHAANHSTEEEEFRHIIMPLKI